MVNGETFGDYLSIESLFITNFLISGSTKFQC